MISHHEIIDAVKTLLDADATLNGTSYLATKEGDSKVLLGADRPKGIGNPSIQGYILTHEINETKLNDIIL